MSKQTCLITGGSSGIGLELGKQLAKEGYHVIILGRDQKKLAHAKKSIESCGGQCSAYSADVIDWETLQQLSKTILGQVGPIEFLVINAGIVHADTISDMDMTRIESILQINLIGAVKSIKAFLPLMINQSQILFIASGLGVVSPAGYAAYSASKAGMISLAETLRHELKHRKIKVQVACLTDTDTPQYRNELKNMPVWMQSKSYVRKSAMSVEKVARLLRKMRRSSRFFIFVSWDVFIAYVLTKLLPRRVRDKIVDLLFPRPLADEKKIA